MGESSSLAEVDGTGALLKLTDEDKRSDSSLGQNVLLQSSSSNDRGFPAINQMSMSDPELPPGVTQKDLNALARKKVQNMAASGDGQRGSNTDLIQGALRNKIVFSDLEQVPEGESVTEDHSGDFEYRDHSLQDIIDTNEEIHKLEEEKVIRDVREMKAEKEEKVKATKDKQTEKVGVSLCGRVREFVGKSAGNRFSVWVCPECECLYHFLS